MSFFLAKAPSQSPARRTRFTLGSAVNAECKTASVSSRALIAVILIVGNARGASRAPLLTRRIPAWPFRGRIVPRRRNREVSRLKDGSWVDLGITALLHLSVVFAITLRASQFITIPNRIFFLHTQLQTHSFGGSQRSHWLLRVAWNLLESSIELSLLSITLSILAFLSARLIDPCSWYSSILKEVCSEVTLVQPLGRESPTPDYSQQWLVESLFLI